MLKRKHGVAQWLLLTGILFILLTSFAFAQDSEETATPEATETPAEEATTPEAAETPAEEATTPEATETPSEATEVPAETPEAPAEGTEVPAETTEAPTDGATEETGEAAEETAPGEPGKLRVKGELISINFLDIQPNKNRVGALVGMKTYSTDEDNLMFMTVDPRIDVYGEKFKLGLGAPLSYEFFNNEDSYHSPTLRKEDYDSYREYAKWLRYLSWGRKEDRFYFSLGQVSSNTIGHGTVMRRYVPNLDADFTRIGALMDAYNDYLGFQLQTNDVTSFNIIGALLFLKPLSLFSDSWRAKSFSIGLTYIADTDAPHKLHFKNTTLGDDAEYVVSTGVDKAGEDSNGVPASASQVRRVMFADEGADKGLPIYDGESLSVTGISMEFKLFRSANADIKPYLDYNMFNGGGNGLFAGFLGRFNFGDSLISAFRTIIEFRTFTNKYQPSYFDSLYEISKYQYPIDPDKGTWTTKYNAIMNLEEDEERRYGYYVELQYALMEYIAFGVALESSNQDNGKNFFAHVEFPAMSFLMLRGTYMKLNFNEMSDISAFDSKDANTILQADIRLQLIPIMFINFKYARIFQKRDNPDAVGSMPYQNVNVMEPKLEIGIQF